MNDLSLNCF